MGTKQRRDALKRRSADSRQEQDRLRIRNSSKWKAGQGMTREKSLIDSAIRGWKSNVERADKLFGGLSSEQLEQEVTPGRNCLIYLWGHLAAANDGLLPLLGVGGRLHPEFDAMFTSNPDKSVPLTVSGPSLKAARQEIHQKL